MIRIGEGYDLHSLVEGRPLRLACTTIPYERGSLGHSDGDVVAHAVCDALLGSLALGDLGRFFPSSDERWRGADSSVFLNQVMAKLAEQQASIVNLDVTVELEAPRLLPHLDGMRASLASVLGVDVGRVSIKAKTGEGLGPVGEGRAVAARAVVLVELGWASS